MAGESAQLRIRPWVNIVIVVFHQINVNVRMSIRMNKWLLTRYDSYMHDIHFRSINRSLYYQRILQTHTKITLQYAQLRLTSNYTTWWTMQMQCPSDIAMKAQRFWTEHHSIICFNISKLIEHNIAQAEVYIRKSKMRFKASGWREWCYW